MNNAVCTNSTCAQEFYLYGLLQKCNPMTDAAPTIGTGVSSLHIGDFTGGRLPLDISASDESS